MKCGKLGERITVKECPVSLQSLRSGTVGGEERRSEMGMNEEMKTRGVGASK